MTQDDIHAKGLNSEPAQKYPKIKGRTNINNSLKYFET